ncbi:glycosyltransferase family 2 protein [Pseudoduganella ginsengisoli]|uniref:Glycosyltransferase n=1 Tax=Pseudoduganella ginsengisoli TaxID=1462440 RepID=A0A6L6Q4Q1_9BURK|nr:glycosyltransferase family 2 protein [Pseudoduganella ginsengisoli]MTW04833.1 glycosyltransferase [Pseudoduganella ginsengisoli]
MTLHTIERRRHGRQSVSVVLPVLNEAPSLAILLPRVAHMLERCGVDWEAVIVNDGGNDGLEDVVAQFETSWHGANVQLLHLSRNFGKEAALTAGLAAARGDAVITMDGDGQHPAGMLPEMISAWRDGVDMAIAAQHSRDRESWVMRSAKRLFYRLLQGGERFRIPSGAGDFRLLDRRVVQALLQLPERTRYMKGLFAWMGFKTRVLPFDAEARTAGNSKFKWWQLLELASLGMTSFSMKPLRMVSLAGVVISLLAIAYGLYIAAEKLIVGNALSGWATLASGMMLLSGIQLICLGVIAEYLGRIFEETKQRPLYILDRRVDHSAVGQTEQPQPLRPRAAP